jgi:hypothetical protein
VFMARMASSQRRARIARCCAIMACCPDLFSPLRWYAVAPGTLSELLWLVVKCPRATTLHRFNLRLLSPVDCVREPPRQFLSGHWIAVALVLVVLGSQCGLGWSDASKVIPGPQGDLPATQSTATQVNASITRPNVLCGSWNTVILKAVESPNDARCPAFYSGSHSVHWPRPQLIRPGPAELLDPQRART